MSYFIVWLVLYSQKIGGFELPSMLSLLSEIVSQLCFIRWLQCNASWIEATILWTNGRDNLFCFIACLQVVVNTFDPVAYLGKVIAVFPYYVRPLAAAFELYYSTIIIFVNGLLFLLLDKILLAVATRLRGIRKQITFTSEDTRKMRYGHTADDRAVRHFAAVVEDTDKRVQSIIAIAHVMCFFFLVSRISSRAPALLKCKSLYASIAVSLTICSKMFQFIGLYYCGQRVQDEVMLLRRALLYSATRMALPDAKKCTAVLPSLGHLRRGADLSVKVFFQPLSWSTFVWYAGICSTFGVSVLQIAIEVFEHTRNPCETILI